MKMGDIVILEKSDKWTDCDNLIVGKEYEITDIGLERTRVQKGGDFKVNNGMYWQNKSNFKLKQMELKITPEKIKEAAAKCPQAEATLKTLFPEVFEDDKYFDLMKWAKNPDGWEFGELSNNSPTIGIDDDLKNGISYRFILNPYCNWELKDNYLIPTKK